MAMKEQSIDYSALDIGMVDNGEVSHMETIQRYIDYFQKNGLLRFTSYVYNGAGWYRTDILGNDLIKIVITLSENGQVFAETNLKFKNFKFNKINKTGNVIQFPKGDK